LTGYTLPLAELTAGLAGGTSETETNVRDACLLKDQKWDIAIVALSGIANPWKKPHQNSATTATAFPAGEFHRSIKDIRQNTGSA
jgi:hypothetical protein